MAYHTSYTTSDIDTLEAALLEVATNPVTLTISGRTVTYTTVDQIARALEIVRRSIASASPSRRRTAYVLDLSGGNN